MAEKFAVKARNVANVGSSKTAIIDLPVGKRYHTVILQVGYAAGTNTIVGAMSHVSEIRVLANNRVQRVFSGAQLRDLNLLNGTEYDCQGLPNTAPGVSLPIFFAEPWRKDSASQDALAWDTSGFSSFRIEVDLGAVGTQTANSQTLTATAVVDNFRAANPQFVTVQRQQVAAAGTSFDITTIERKGVLQQVNFYPDSTNDLQATIITVRRDGDIIRELPFADNFALLTNNGMTPTASGRTDEMFDIVFDHDDLLNSSLVIEGAKELSFTVEAASAMAGSMTFLVSRLGRLL